MNGFCFAISLGFLIINIIFIKKRRLEFEHSILWILICAVMIFLSINNKLVEFLAKSSGIIYAPAFLFLVGIIFSFFMIFYLMIVISDLKKKTTKLIQECALLEQKANKDVAE